MPRNKSRRNYDIYNRSVWQYYFTDMAKSFFNTCYGIKLKNTNYRNITINPMTHTILRTFGFIIHTVINTKTLANIMVAKTIIMERAAIALQTAETFFNMSNNQMTIALLTVASGNVQVNDASNNADVHLSTGGHHKDIGGVNKYGTVTTRKAAV